MTITQALRCQKTPSGLPAYSQSEIKICTTLYVIVEKPTQDDQQKKKEIIVLDPSALQYLIDISLTLQDGYEVFLPDELYEDLDEQKRFFLIKLLNYWNGYKLSDKRIDKLISDIRGGKRIHKFSELEFEYNDEGDLTLEELIKSRKGPRDRELRYWIFKIISKTIAFAKKFQASIVSMSNKLFDLLSSTSMNILNLSEGYVKSLKELPVLVRLLKDNKWIKKSKKYISYIIDMISGIIGASSIHPILGGALGVTVPNVLLVMDP